MRFVPAGASALSVLGVIAVVLWQMHLPLLLSNSLATGGDTGAHVMMPAFIKQYLLPHGQLTGWDPQWYDGYPIYTFYFVLPDVLVALASYVIPYAVAFKLATVLGSITLPIAAWACGRLFGLRPPLPAALAAATLPFLFDYTWTIYGGNLFSTLAGEYAYSLSITLAVLFLGLFARGIRTGRHRTWAAIVLALCILAHIVPAMLALAGAGLLIVFELLPARLRPTDSGRVDRPGESARPPGPLPFAPPAPHPPSPVLDRPTPPEGTAAPTGPSTPALAAVPEPTLGPRRALWWGVSTLAIGIALSGWWLVPFGVRQPYSTSMGYTNVTTWLSILFPTADIWAVVLAGIAVLVALVRRSRFGLLVGLLGGLSAAALILDPQGSLYNVRFLPLWFLCVYLLAGWMFATVVRVVALWWRRDQVHRWLAMASAADRAGLPRPRWPRPPRFEPAAVSGPLVCLLGACIVVVTPFVLPASVLPVTPGPNQVSNWAEWNYTGYQGKPAYPELEALIATMQRVGRRYGCGRAMWEYNADLNRFGTPESLMLLPYWTDDCIDSMEGLLFESSATTPYHFLNQAELSVGPSEPVVGLPYGPLDVPLGVEHLQLLGVRYFLAASPQVEQAADADPSLRLVATTGPWHSVYGTEVITTTWDVYVVKDSALVTPLHDEPAVFTDVGPSQSSWLDPSVAWYDDPARWAVELAAGGPADWPRVRAGQRPPRVKVAATTVSRISVGVDTVSFHVSRVGTPVLVKVSYFPNWQAVGATGPYRVTPNLMVVVPTSHDVVLRYGTTHANELGDAASGAGVVVLVALAVLGYRRRRRARPAPPPEAATS